jgi:hypothetical protein
MSELLVNTIKKADGTGSLSVPAESGTVVTTASPSLGRRNLIINGAMQVAQRGTSTTGISSGASYYTSDRWNFSVGTGGTWTATQSTTAPEGFSNSYKLECTTANASLSSGSLAVLQQAIEGQNLQHLKYGTANAETITMSFWVRSAKTGTYIAEIYGIDNARQISKSYTIDSADTWEKKTIVFEGDTVGSLDNDNNVSFWCIFWLAAGTDFTSGTLSTTWTANTNANRVVGQVNLADTVGNNIYITGVQLEVGSVATPFEHRSYGEEEMLCRRYFQLITRSATAGDVYDNKIYGAVYGASGSFIQRPFVPPMRATPDLSYSVGGSNGYSEIYTSNVNLGLYDDDDVTNRIYNARADAEL